MEVCEFCHEEFDPEELIEFGGRQMCADCLESQTIVCDRCGARIWRNGNAGDSDTYLCDSCFENYYTKLFTSYNSRSWGHWFLSEPAWCQTVADEMNYINDLKAVARYLLIVRAERTCPGQS